MRRRNVDSRQLISMCGILLVTGACGGGKTDTKAGDSTSPTVTASPASGAYRAAVAVALLCDDGTGSGCGVTRYTTDGTTPVAASAAYTAPISILASGQLRFFALDNAGNASAVRTESYVIDPDPPSVVATPAGGAYATAVSVSLACEDGAGSGCASIHVTSDGSTPSRESPVYATPIPVASTSTIKFVGLDAAGNLSGVFAEAYLIDLAPPSVSASPAGGAYGVAQSVTLTCSDGSGSGCASIHFTTDGTAPTTASTLYTAPVHFDSSATLKFIAVDGVGLVSGVVTESYVINLPTGISLVRAAVDGALNVAVKGALTTYVRPLVGGDPAGFFLQEGPNGPALFVAVDPATLAPPPAVGDRVSLTATEKVTVTGVTEIVSLSGWTVVRSGDTVEPWRADVSSVADLPSVIDAYESELISISGSVSSASSAAGSGFVAASLSTTGTPSGANLELRVPTTLAELADLAPGCSVTLRAPLWRYLARAQATAWAAPDMTILACPAPRVISAASWSPSSVNVVFDRLIDAGSVLGGGSQFTVTSGLAVSAASVSGRTVQLTTSSQVPGQGYALTVAGSVTDTLGKALDASASSAAFAGYRPPATLRISEVAPNVATGRDVVELVVQYAGTTLGMTLVQDTSTLLATFPDVQVAAGDLIVVHLRPDVGVSDAPASEGTSKTQFRGAVYPSNYDTAWDFHGGTTGVTFSNRILRVKDPSGVTQDGAAFALPAMGSPPIGFPAALQQLQADGQWLPANCGGAACTYTSTPSATAIAADWTTVSNDRITTISRTAAGDTNQASDWTVGPSTLGVQ